MTFSVKCDWLDITTSADSETPENIINYVSAYASDIQQNEEKNKTVIDIAGGVLQVEIKKRWARVSASGKVLDAFRMLKIFDNYLDTLGALPHKVTRLDAAYDTQEDGADILAKLRRRYRSERPSLSRKALPVSVIISRRDIDNRETGTFYAGHRTRAQVTARVYDKQHELKQKQGLEVSPRTRYELTVKGGMSPSLRDAAEPSRVFWHYMAPTFLKKPAGVCVKPWEPGWGGSWESTSVEVDLVKRLKSLVENSTVIDQMISVADEISPAEGRAYLARLLSTRIGKNLPENIS